MRPKPTRLLVLLILAVGLFPACDPSADGPAAPGAGQIALIEGHWEGTIALTQVTGSGCIPRQLRTFVGLQVNISAEISQTGELITAMLSTPTLDVTISGTLDDLGALTLDRDDLSLITTEDCDGKEYTVELVDAAVRGSATTERLAFTLILESEISLDGSVETTMVTRAEVELTR